jgi:ribosomal-protein-alanine N-acetyltransferase
MDIVIRSLVKNDLSEILRIERNSFPDPWSENKFLEEFKLKFSYLYVAVLDNRPCGYIVLRHINDEGNIMNLAVCPECRRQGIGRKLINRIIDLARNKKIHSIFLEVRTKNIPAIRLYESFGFKTYTTRKKYYPDDDALLMGVQVK